MFFDNDKLTLGKKITILAQWADDYDAKTDNGKKSGFSTIEESAQASRKPRGDMPLATLLHKPFSFVPPANHEYCSQCGDWRPRSYFALNAAYKRGVDYNCRECKAALDRQRRIEAAAQEGRELRAYRRRWETRAA